MSLFIVSFIDVRTIPHMGLITFNKINQVSRTHYNV